MKKKEFDQQQLFSFDTAPQSQSRGDVAPSQELPAGDALLGSFARLPVQPRRSAAQPSEPLSPSHVSQSSMFTEAEIEQGEMRTLADCFVTMQPVIEVTQKTEHGKTIKREEWKCTFTSPPDLWHMDNPTIVHTSTTDADTIKLAKAEKLKRGNYVTLIGRVTSEFTQPMENGAEARHIIYLTLTGIADVVRPSNAKSKTNIVPLRRQR